MSYGYSVTQSGIVMPVIAPAIWPFLALGLEQRKLLLVQALGRGYCYGGVCSGIRVTVTRVKKYSHMSNSAHDATRA